MNIFCIYLYVIIYVYLYMKNFLLDLRTYNYGYKNKVAIERDQELKVSNFFERMEDIFNKIK